MTGSGTLADPYVIWDVDDLQAVRNDCDKYYVLGANIDASATSGWNGGRGFEPLDWAGGLWRRPTGDFASTGAWTVFPVAPATLYDKVDDEDCDEDTTYIRTDAVGGTVLFTHPAFNLPAGSTITYIRVYITNRDEGGVGNVSYRSYVRVGGVNYQSPNLTTFGASATYRLRYVNGFTTNPATGLAWTVDDINGVGANPLEACGILVSGKVQRISQIFFHVCYTPLTQPIFDGQGYTISDLFINRSGDPLSMYWGNDCALFSYAYGIIRNITLENVDITGDDEAAGLCGFYYQGQGISNCNVTGDIVGVNDCGAIVGVAWQGDGISSCTFEGTITATGTDSGGIAGYSDLTDISDCESSGTLNGGALVGSIVGYGDDINVSGCYSSMALVVTSIESGGIAGELTVSGLAPLAVSMEQCYFVGSISSSDDVVGGVIGVADDVVILECFSSGNVSSPTGFNIGGFVGRNYAYIHDCYARGSVAGFDSVAGFTGRHWDYSIEDCYSTGQVTAAIGVGATEGGFAVEVTDPITNCFWDTQASGQATSYGGTGRTTAVMKTRNNFTDAGWDFTTVWDICQPPYERTYPFLQWEGVVCSLAYAGNILIDQLIYQHCERMRR